MPASAEEWLSAESGTSRMTLEHGDDVFATVEVTIDPARHVRPLKMVDGKETRDQFKTMTKYTYSEAGNYVKVDLPDLPGLVQGENRIVCDFKERSLFVKIYDVKTIGNNYVFGVKKLQCKILPKDCSYLIKPKCLQLKLRKKKEDDNWHSLFHSPAIGERDSDCD